MLKLNGIFPPLPTAFDSNEKLAPEKMQLNIKKLCQYDLSGFLILGSNGELVCLSEKEKVKVYEAAREAIPSDKIMLSGTGGQSTRETIILTKAAVKAGADAALVLNPFYYKGLMTKEALVYHYHSVADSSEIPVIIYNMPANSGLDMNQDIISAISEHPNIIGLKDSSGNVTKMGDIKRICKPDFQILAGSAGFLLPALSIGAVGGILALANIAPQYCLDIYQAYMNGELEKSREFQLKMIPVNAAITSKWGIPALKYVLDQIGMYGGPARKPVLPVNEKTKKELGQMVKEFQLI
jgi:4-hydroxy-2-oxoglutarate aldolase